MAFIQGIQIAVQNGISGPRFQHHDQDETAAARCGSSRRFPVLRRIPGYVVGVGVRPEHIRTPEAGLREVGSGPSPPNAPSVTKHFSRFMGALAAAVLIVTPFSPGPVRAADPYTIDVILALTGPFAFLGKSEGESLKTLETLVNKEGGINGQPLHFNLLDDQTQPAVAVQIANGILAKHPAVMLGPTDLSSCLAIAPLMRNGPVDYCFAPTIHPAPGSFVFSGGASSYDQAIETLVFAKAKGWKRIAVVATADATGQDISGTVQRGH